MKKILFILIISLFFIKNKNLTAQNKYFEKQYAWDMIHNGFSILPNNQGNYVISGQAFDNDYSWYSYSIEIDNYGTAFPSNRYLEFEPTYEGAMKEMIKTEYGFFLGGWGLNISNESNLAKTYYVMVNEEGVHIKSDTLGNTNYRHYNYTCTRTSDNGYFLAGEITTGTTLESIHPYLIKLNENGEQVWDSIYYNYPGRAYFNDIIPANDGSGYYAMGGLNLSTDEGDILLVKIDENGVIIQQNIYDLGGQDYVGKFIQKKDGGFVILGVKHYFQSDNTVIMNIDSSGQLLSETYGYYQDKFIEKVIELPDSSLVFTGFAYSDEGAFDNNMQLLKLDKNFMFQWKRQYGGSADDYGYDIIEALDGGFIISGRTASNTDIVDLYVVKTNCMGLLTEPQADFSGELDNENLIATAYNESLYVYPDSIDGGFFVWDFGDNSAPITTENNDIQTHQYHQAGQYTTTLLGIVCNDTSIVKKTYCIGTQNATADFSFTNQDIGLYSFSPTENYQNAAFLWNFGDNTMSNEQFPTHQFAQNGHYNITFSLILCNDTISYSQNVLVDGVGISDKNNDLADKILLFPNPAKDELHINFTSFETENIQLSITDILGKTVLKQDFESKQGENNILLQIDKLQTGYYFLTIDNGTQQSIEKFMVW